MAAILFSCWVTRSLRFCGFSEQRKTIFDNLAAREMGTSEKLGEGGGERNFERKMEIENRLSLL